MSDSTRRTVVAVLVVAVVAAAIALGWAVRDRRDAQRPVGGNTAEAVGAVVGSDTLKTEVRTVAEDAAARVFSYSHESLTADKAAARALLTGQMLEQYDDTMAGVVGTSLANKTVVTATVLDSALISVTERNATVLVFVNQRTTGTDLKRPLLDLDRVVVTLQRASGEWKVSELDAL